MNFQEFKKNEIDEIKNCFLKNENKEQFFKNLSEIVFEFKYSKKEKHYLSKLLSIMYSIEIDLLKKWNVKDKNVWRNDCFPISFFSDNVFYLSMGCLFYSLKEPEFKWNLFYVKTLTFNHEKRAKDVQNDIEFKKKFLLILFKDNLKNLAENLSVIFACKPTSLYRECLVILNKEWNVKISKWFENYCCLPISLNKYLDYPTLENISNLFEHLIFHKPDLKDQEFFFEKILFQLEQPAQDKTNCFKIFKFHLSNQNENHSTFLSDVIKNLSNKKEIFSSPLFKKIHFWLYFNSFN